MLIKNLFILFLCFFSTLSFADNFCRNSSLAEMNTKSVDLRYEMGPIRDQDSIGWCYGFTGADLLTHYLYKTKAREVIRPDKNADYRNPDYTVSAVGMSVFFNRAKNSDYFNGVGSVKNAKELAQKYKKKVVAESGNIHEAILAAKKEGFCFEKDLPSENFGYVLDKRCAVSGKCTLQEMLQNVFDSANIPQTCTANAPIKKIFPTIPERSINHILMFTEKVNAIDRLVSVACKKRFTKHLISEDEPVVKWETLNDPASKSFRPGFKKNTPEDLVNKIDAILERGTPVGIEYYADFLLKENAGAGSSHASTIVGKRFNLESCEVEYILRNSWGPNCDMYNMENPNYPSCVLATRKETKPNVVYEKLRNCREKFTPVPRNPRVSCDPKSGYAYIRKTDLSKYLNGLSYIEE